MSDSSRKKALALLTSPRVAAWLLGLLGAIAFVGTLTPQGRPDDPRVVAWDVAHPQVARLVVALDLHGVFSSPLFTLLVLLLAASTAACAWRRTKTSRARYRVLSALRGGNVPEALRPPTFRLVAPSVDPSEALERVSTQLDLAGFPTRREGNALILASNPLVAFGSAVFHWSLVAFFVVVFLSAMVRSDGLLGVGLGERVPNVAESYGVLSRGPLHAFATPPQQIALEAFELDFDSDGIEAGPTPTVALYGGDGVLLARQRVYPNHPLKHGSVTVHGNEFGLSQEVALIDPEGVEVARSTVLVDFSDETTSGTLPSKFALTDPQGRPAIEVSVELRTDRNGGAVVREIPRDPRALMTLTSLADGRQVGQGELAEGDSLTLPNGSSVKLLGVGYYARLNVVDDWTIPVLYAVLALLVVAVSVALVGSQRVLVVEFSEGDSGTLAHVIVRTWRYAGFTVDEIETLIGASLGGITKGGTDV